MATSNPSSGRSTPFRDSVDSEKMEAAGSWDAIEWTKIEVSSISYSSFLSFLQGFTVYDFFPVILLNFPYCFSFVFFIKKKEENLFAAPFWVRVSQEFGILARRRGSHNRGTQTAMIFFSSRRNFFFFFGNLLNEWQCVSSLPFVVLLQIVGCSFQALNNLVYNWNGKVVQTGFQHIT